MSQSTKKPEYSVEFKQSAVKLAVEGERSIAATARELGVNVNTLHTWVGKYHKAGNKAAEKVSEQHLYDELNAQRKEIKRLKEERDILKKAAAYFANESL